MPGEPDQVDEVAVRASDPFGSSPTVTLHLPGEAGAAEGMALSLADLEAPSGSHSEPAGAGAPLQADGLEWRSLVPLETDMARSEEHTSELQSLMRISYAVFCLYKK